MTGAMVLIVVLALVPAIVQLFVINLYCRRMARAVRRGADKPPYTTAVEILQLGPSPDGVARLLDRTTRLDTEEIDALIDARGGGLPLRMSRLAALNLVHDLRELGADAAARYDPAWEAER